MLNEYKAPPPLLKHSLASPSTVADVMVQKYVDGIPLARQEKVWKRDGIALTRATLANWVSETSQVWPKPLYRMIRQHLTGLDVIHTDEAVVQIHREGQSQHLGVPDVGVRQRTVQ